VNKTRVSDANITRIGMGYGKELKITWNGTASSSGLVIEVAQTVSAVPDGRYAPEKSGMKNAGNRSFFQYTLAKDGPVEISVFRLNGRKLWGNTENKNAGIHEFAVDQLPAKMKDARGTPYLVRITADNQSRMYKIMPGLSRSF
jgi:hypothetical protein